MYQINNRFNWRHLLLVFALVFAGLFLFGYNAPIPKTFDAAGYWGLAGHFVRTGGFSLLEYDSSLRGYLFPLLLIAPRVVAYLGHLPNGMMEIFLGAVQAALLFGWVLPDLYASIRPNSVVSLGRRMLFVAVGLFFWGGYFAYTLSDFPATLAFSGALLLLLKSRSRLFALAGAGVLAGAALNTRPFYLLSIPFVLLLAATLAPSEGQNWSQRLRNVAIVLVGIALPLIPQWRINHVNFDSNSPLVLAQITKGDDLFLTQLGWGLTIQKFETALGSAPDGSNARVFYKDRKGEELLVQAGYKMEDNIQFKNTSEYVRIISHNPLIVSGIYLTRLFNGLDQHHRTPYIRQPVQDFTWLMPIVNYTLWFGVLLLLWTRRSTYNKVSYTQIMTLVAWVIPCSVACIVAIENRFLLPVHLLLYAILCFELKRDELQTLFKTHSAGSKAIIIGFYSAFIAVCLAFSWSIHQQQFLELL